VQHSPAVLAMEGVAPEDVRWRWAARLVLVACLGILVFAVHRAWKGRRTEGDRG
jgi:hypothetical protein